ncbi:hypothetical protein FRB99_008652 [Tulasnella sp. 403]|nr:hypothetical protein FRB99_008652 [Tulasnella sp. 403]
MTMFSLAKAIGEILAPEFIVISVFPAGSAPHEMTLNLELEDEISVTARIGCDTENNPAALRWLQRKYAREVASLNYLENALPSVPVPYVIQLDPNTSNAVHGPYVMVEDPLGEALQTAVHEMDMPQKEVLAAALGEALAKIHRLALPNRIGSISATDARGQPIVGPLARAWGQSSRAEGPFENIKQYLSNELSQSIRIAQDDPAAGESVRNLLLRLNALVPHITPANDPAMMRTALCYSDLKDSSLFALEDGTLGGIAGLEGTVLPACLAASYPVFLRRDGIHSKTYRNPASGNQRYLLPDIEVAHLRDVFLEATKRIEPSFSVALAKGEKLRQMLEFMNTSNWEGLRKWESDTRRELGMR